VKGWAYAELEGFAIPSPKACATGSK